MRIRNNIATLKAHMAQFKTLYAQRKCLRRLSTGLRINTAADDAAGLGISENLRVQVRSGKQASRNAQDAVSFLQVGEGAMNEIHALLQRGRELTLEASNDTLTDTERAYIQQEIAEIIEEIDRIAASTQYNGIKCCQSTVSSSLAEDITSGLRKTWLNDAESLIMAQYGFAAAAGTALTIHFESSISWASAYVESQGVGGATDMYIDTSSAIFNPGFSEGTDTGESGGATDLHSDRIIAHEMVHAMIYQNVAAASSLPTWFHEGIAEFIHGGDEVLKSVLGTNTPTEAQAQSMISASRLDQAWQGDFSAYATAYSAVRYLDWRCSGAGSNFRAFMQSLRGGANLDSAISTHTAGRYADTDAFISEFQGGGAQDGAWFIASSGQISLDPVGTSESDTGAIGGGSPTTVVTNTVTAPDSNPTGFDIEFAQTSDTMSIRCGANATDSDAMEISTAGVSAGNLGLDNIDVSTLSGAVAALEYFADAIDSLSLSRSLYGSVINRLTHAVQNQEVMVQNSQAAETVIRDCDVAQESSACTKNRILTQASTAMIAQANMRPRSILQLLKPW